MYCTQCGQQLSDESKFCSQCGKAAGAEAQPPVPHQRLVRVRQGKKIAGVCAGFARYLSMDATLVRVVWVVTALTAGVGFIAYVVCWIAMPYDDVVAYSNPDANRYPVANG